MIKEDLKTCYPEFRPYEGNGKKYRKSLKRKRNGRGNAYPGADCDERRKHSDIGHIDGP